MCNEQDDLGYEDPEETAERARLKQASEAAEIGNLDEPRLRQLLALAQLLLLDVGRPELDLSGLDLAAQQALLSMQVGDLFRLACRAASFSWIRLQ